MKIILVIIMLMVFVNLLNCSPKYPIKLTIVYSSDLEGNIIPTGCGKVYYGGIPRRGTAVKRILKENPDAIVLDAGSPFYSRDMFYTWPESLITEWNNNAEIIAKAMKITKVQAGCIGNCDLFNGFKNLKELNKKADYPLLSLNLVDKTSQKPYFKPYKIIKYKGLKIAVIGITSPEERFKTIITVMAREKDKDMILQNLEIKRPKQLLTDLIQKLRKNKEADFIIVLSNLGSMDDINLINEVDGVDVLIGSGIGIEYLETVKVKNTIMCRAGGAGKFLGRIDFYLDGSNKPYGEKRKLDELIKDIKYFKEENKKEQLEEAENDLKFFQDENGKINVQFFENNLIFLGKDMEDDPEMVNLLPEKYKGMIKDCNGLKKQD